MGGRYWELCSYACYFFFFFGIFFMPLVSFGKKGLLYMMMARGEEVVNPLDDGFR